MYYQKHVFVCTNQRPEGKASCGNHQATTACSYVKMQTKLQGLAGPDGIRVSQSGCLGRCDEGPVMVVYPEAHWYTYRDQADLDQIIEQDLIGGKSADDLRLPDSGQPDK